MNNLFDKLCNEFKSSIKAGNLIRKNIISYIIAKIKDDAIINNRDITNDLCIKVIRKLINQHKESISQFNSNNRIELAEKELKELDILLEFVPKLKSKAETIVIVKSIIENNKVPTDNIKKSLGIIMRCIKSLPEANLIDMKLVLKIINELF